MRRKKPNDRFSPPIDCKTVVFVDDELLRLYGRSEGNFFDEPVITSLLYAGIDVGYQYILKISTIHSSPNTYTTRVDHTSIQEEIGFYDSLPKGIWGDTNGYSEHWQHSSTTPVLLCSTTLKTTEVVTIDEDDPPEGEDRCNGKGKGNGKCKGKGKGNGTGKSSIKTK